MPQEYMTMEEAMRELGLSEDEVKKLTADGKLRSFRDGGVTKFRTSDIHTLSGKAPAEEEKIPLGEEEPPRGKRKEEAREESLESIFGATEHFDIAPLEEEELLAEPIEEIKEVVEVKPSEAEEIIEPVELLGEEAIEEITPLPEEGEVTVKEGLLEEIEEKGEELEGAEVKEFVKERARIAPFAPQYTLYTVFLIASFALLVFMGLAVVNSVVLPTHVHGILKPITDKLLDLTR